MLEQATIGISRDLPPRPAYGALTKAVEELAAQGATGREIRRALAPRFRPASIDGVVHRLRLRGVVEPMRKVRPRRYVLELPARLAARLEAHAEAEVQSPAQAARIALALGMRVLEDRLAAQSKSASAGVSK